MQPEKQFYDERFFIEESASSGNAARKMVPMALEVLNINSVLDIGCGVGMFLKTFADNGVNEIKGVDGDYLPPQHRQIPQDCFQPHDLKLPLRLNQKYDLVMSLEVAEHLPDSSADGFVESICQHGDVVMFSAAVPEQGGTNHINEQWQDYWAEKFAARGYMPVDYFRPRLWSEKEVHFWYCQNTLFYANANGLEKQPNLAEFAARAPKWTSLNIVHPYLYNARLGMLKDRDRIVQALQQFLNQLNQLKKAS